MGSSMSRLFPEPLTDRVFQPFFHDFLLRPPQPHLPFGMSNSSSPLLNEELDTFAITTKVKEKLAAHNLGQKVRTLVKKEHSKIMQSVYFSLGLWRSSIRPVSRLSE